MHVKLLSIVAYLTSTQEVLPYYCNVLKGIIYLGVLGICFLILHVLGKLVLIISNTLLDNSEVICS